MSEAIRIDFYVLENATGGDRLQFACRLAEKAVHLDHHVFLLAPDEPAAMHLDELLWTFRAESFLPHALATATTAMPLPVIIGFGDTAETAGGDLLINLSPTVPACYDNFARVAEIIDSGERCRREGRARFSFYRDNGMTPETHRIT